MNWRLKLGPNAAHDSGRKAIITAVATTATAALCGQIENGNAAQPINDISHIAYGDKAFEQDGFTLRYTATGLSLTKSVNATWALLHEILFGEYQDEGNVPVSLAGGAFVAAFAYLFDYHVVPKRFTPGFEKHLSKRSLLAIYVVLALCLGLGGIKNAAKT